MSESFGWKIIRSNWYLVAVLLVCFGVVAYKFSTGDSGETGRIAPVSSSAQVTPAWRPADGLSQLNQSSRTARERALEIIRSHEEKVQADPTAADAPALMAAAGNLYRQKVGDYAEAARCYEVLLGDYPDSVVTRTAYVQLATCYEQLGESEKSMKTYNRMLEFFPEGSQEHQFALAKLTGAID